MAHPNGPCAVASHSWPARHSGGFGGVCDPPWSLPFHRLFGPRAHSQWACGHSQPTRPITSDESSNFLSGLTDPSRTGLVGEAKSFGFDPCAAHIPSAECRAAVLRKCSISGVDSRGELDASGLAASVEKPAPLPGPERPFITYRGSSQPRSSLVRCLHPVRVGKCRGGLSPFRRRQPSFNRPRRASPHYSPKEHRNPRRPPR